MEFQFYKNKIKLLNWNWKKIIARIKFFSNFFFFVIIPIPLIYYIFWGSSVNLQLKNTNNWSNVKVEIIDNPGFLTYVRNVLQVPFDLSILEVCLINKSDYSLKDIVMKNDQGNIVWDAGLFEKGSRICTVTHSRNFSVGRRIESPNLPTFILENGSPKMIQNLEEAKREVKIEADNNYGARPLFGSKLVSSFIFFIAYITVLEVSSRWLKKVFKILRFIIIFISNPSKTQSGF
ncbi:MAG: hypothetical protein K8Q91_01855 [Candidatus Vogelbacteria bacterium]|nr:hypothetical protein [Candidatus Vogelbacteria bacterium]